MAAKTETTAGSGVVSVLVSGSSHSSKFLSHDRSLLARVCACHRRGDLLQGRLDEVQPGRWECVPKQVMLHVRLMCKCMVLPSLACAVLLVVGTRMCVWGSHLPCRLGMGLFHVMDRPWEAFDRARRVLRSGPRCTCVYDCIGHKVDAAFGWGE